MISIDFTHDLAHVVGAACIGYGVTGTWLRAAVVAVGLLLFFR